MLWGSLPAILLKFVGDGVKVFAFVLGIFLLALEFAHSFEHALFLHLKSDVFANEPVQIVLESSGDAGATPTAQDFVGSETVDLASKLGLNALHVILQLIGLRLNVDVFGLKNF